MSGAAPFEVLRFTGAPVAPDVALLELEGRFAERAPRGRSGTFLVVESAAETLELAPSAAHPLPEGHWRAVYAVPLALVGGAVYSLAVGRHLLVDLPAPDMTDALGDPIAHHVRLAREANDLRARLDAAEEVRDTALASAQEASAAEERERTARTEVEAAHERAQAELTELRAELEQARTALDGAQASGEQRLAEVRAELEAAVQAAREQAERDLAAAREEGERRLAEAHADAERREEETVAAERARASVTSHELRSARAEIESLKRELGVRRNAAAAARAGEDGDAPTEITARRTSESDSEVTRRVAPVGGGGEEGGDTEQTRRVAADEGVRVLSARAPRPRHRLEDETEPDSLPPGAAAIGARSFESGAHSSQSARALAIAALAVGMLAALLVIVARVGIF